MRLFIKIAHLIGVVVVAGEVFLFAEAVLWVDAHLAQELPRAGRYRDYVERDVGEHVEQSGFASCVELFKQPDIAVAVILLRLSFPGEPAS